MVVFSKIHEILPEGYGLVIGIGTMSIFVNFYLIHKVMKARKAFDVPYPALYSDTSKEFNCIQRAHQNYLENWPFFCYLLMTGGLQYPRICAASGAVWLVGRVVYAHGYYTGDPEKRNWSMFALPTSFVLMGSVMSFAWHLKRLHNQDLFSVCSRLGQAAAGN